MNTAEHQRLLAHRRRDANWRKWGPYLSERAWGTVREDYSTYGEAWDYFPHDHARSRAYRWNEDGLAGISDRYQNLCFAFALWNGCDSILKERLFGLTGPQGNHGEDVKEYYYYLDNTPTHSYMKMLYKYPQRPFPYADLVYKNKQRTAHDFEYELLDTGIFSRNRYFDVQFEYVKATPDDLLIQVTITNRGSRAASCVLLPTLWYRNTWDWGYEAGPMGKIPEKPQIQLHKQEDTYAVFQATHPTMETYYLYAENPQELIFTENVTNSERLYHLTNETPYVKDSFHRYIVDGDDTAVNPAQEGTKAAAVYDDMIEPGESVTVRLRLCDSSYDAPFDGFDTVFQERIGEANTFYEAVQRDSLGDEARSVQRQAFAGMLWTKQFYYFDVEQWLEGDPVWSVNREFQRNEDWQHLVNYDVISMPDKWEYPWYATWDLAFHCLPLMLIDPDYAKRQLELVTREWYMHPNGQIPAYEWAFDDVNPPVQAWAALRVFQIDEEITGKADLDFLEGLFHKLLLNFTWWVNRKDLDGNNVFEGGFLGLDNISVFDRSHKLPSGGKLEQSDGTAWMGFYSIEMMKIALELASRGREVYQDTATKFFEHFLRIATAISNCDDRLSYSLWDEDDGFFYDVLHLPDDSIVPLKVRSLVGLMPMLAVETIQSDLLDNLRVFHRRSEWFMDNRPHLSGNVSVLEYKDNSTCRLMSLLTRERLVRVLEYMLDEDEFLSPYGIRSLSKYHEDNPFSINLDGETYTVRYLPAESDSAMFGGNSNWRGPVWFPINYLIIEALRKYHRFYGDTLTVEFPTGSGNDMTLDAVADELSRRLIRLFMRSENDERPVYGGQDLFNHDPHWRDYVLFYEYFNGDNGAGLGASHQTGWTGLVANLLNQVGG